MHLKFLLVSFLLVSFQGFAQGVDVLHYKYFIELNDRNDTIYGSAVIDFIVTDSAKTGFGLKSLNEERRGMLVHHVNYKNKKCTYTHHNDTLLISGLNSHNGDTLNVEIFYSGIPADGLIISKNRHGNRTFFADNWPNRAHHWIPCNDRPDDKASFEFIVRAPSHYKVISNGVKKEEKIISDGIRLTHWKEKIPLPTKIMVIGVADFAVKQYKDSPDSIPVTAYIFKPDSSNGFHDYARAPAILKYFTDYIAPYPFQKLANVQSKTIFGGMENASAIFYSENSVNGRAEVEDLLAHEIAHQWFGDMVSEKNFSHLWLSEGFATYLTNVYLQATYGDEKLRERLINDRKQVIEFARLSNQPVVDTISNYMDLLNANSYQKGGWILHMLRNEIGDAAFRETIRTFYKEYKGGNADTRDFEKVTESVSGKELSWFFDQWLFRPGIPKLALFTQMAGNDFILYVTQQGEPFRFSLEVELVEEDGGVRKERFEVTEKESKFTVKVKGNSVKFRVDPDVNLLYESVD